MPKYSSINDLGITIPEAQNDTYIRTYKNQNTPIQDIPIIEIPQILKELLDLEGKEPKLEKTVENVMHEFANMLLTKDASFWHDKDRCGNKNYESLEKIIKYLNKKPYPKKRSQELQIIYNTNSPGVPERYFALVNEKCSIKKIPIDQIYIILAELTDDEDVVNIVDFLLEQDTTYWNKNQSEDTKNYQYLPAICETLKKMPCFSRGGELYAKWQALLEIYNNNSAEQSGMKRRLEDQRVPQSKSSHKMWHTTPKATPLLPTFQKRFYDKIMRLFDTLGLMVKFTWSINARKSWFESFSKELSRDLNIQDYSDHKKEILSLITLAEKFNPIPSDGFELALKEATQDFEKLNRTNPIIEDLIGEAITTLNRLDLNSQDHDNVDSSGYRPNC